jgi:putative flippase GtrA
MKKSDIFAGLIAGELIAILANVIFANFALRLGAARWVTLAAAPIMVVAGLWIASVLARFWATIWQLAKYITVGALNTAVDLGVLNFLIYLTDITSGLWFSVFKAAGFIGGVTNSFIWNKFWTFQRRGIAGAGKEFSQFFIVSAVGIILNVSIASILVNVIGPPSGISMKLWGNIAAIAAGLAVFSWNFIGYKILVFRA